jgi:hypothetical protein
VLNEKPFTWYVVRLLLAPTNTSNRALLVLDQQQEGINLLAMHINLMVAAEAGCPCSCPTGGMAGRDDARRVLRLPTSGTSPTVTTLGGWA